MARAEFFQSVFEGKPILQTTVEEGIKSLIADKEKHIKILVEF